MGSAFRGVKRVTANLTGMPGRSPRFASIVDNFDGSLRRRNGALGPSRDSPAS